MNSCESFLDYIVTESLIKEYNERFTDFEKYDLTLKLAFQFRLVNASQASKELQMELIELSEDNILRSLLATKKHVTEI